MPYSSSELDAIRRAAPEIATMLADDSWVHRSVESISFLDESRARRQVALDFTIPSEASLICVSSSDLIIPVQLVRKGVIRALDLVDGKGRAVSVLTSGENGELAGAVLSHQAEQALGECLLPPVRDALYRLANERVPSTAAFRSIRHSLDPAGNAQFGEAIRAREVSAIDFWRSFILVARITARPGDRVILKRSYDEEVVVSGGFGRFAANGFFRASSYHLQILAPPDTVIANANLQVLADISRDRRRPDLRRHWVTADARVDRAHLYGRKDAVPESLRGAASKTAQAFVWVRPRSALIEPIVFVSLLTTTLFAVGVLARSRGWNSDEVGTAAVIVALPGLLAGYLASTGHRLTRKLARGIQLAGYATTVASLGAALTLVVRTSGTKHSLPDASFPGVAVVGAAAALMPVMVREIIAARFFALARRGDHSPSALRVLLSRPRFWIAPAVLIALGGVILLVSHTGPNIPGANHPLPARSWLWLLLGSISVFTSVYLSLALLRAWYNAHKNRHAIRRAAHWLARGIRRSLRATGKTARTWYKSLNLR